MNQVWRGTFERVVTYATFAAYLVLLLGMAQSYGVAMGQPPASTGAVVIAVPPPAPISVVGLDWAVLIPLIFVGIGSVITTSFAAFQGYKNGKKADAIHVLVDGGMTKALSDLASAQGEIRLLRELTTSLNMRMSIALPTVEDERAQAVADASRLPSAAVLAAKASTPAKPEP